MKLWAMSTSCGDGRGSAWGTTHYCRLNEAKTQLSVKVYDCSTTDNSEKEVHMPGKDEVVDVVKLFEKKVLGIASESTCTLS